MTSQRGKRGDPNFKQVTGLIPKALALRFKALCAGTERDMSGVIEQLIVDWVEKQEHPAPSDGILDPVIFLKKLVNGTRPTDAEIVEVARALDIQKESLFSFCDQLTAKTKGEPDNDV
ncbi:hypothetical protein SD80_012380 [Scytonema tolypothrichoides VB-61278]|nr:hypothetical protein SD80_012380 [Scytonema tolypothrichoides VB-61278]